MEMNVAILMADLSGYSALTETHGAVTAADLIDKYISLAENCLVGDCRLHQQTGDEIMFVSNSSDVMLATEEFETNIISSPVCWCSLQTPTRQFSAREIYLSIRSAAVTAPCVSVRAL